jgi:hypothetical protein
MTDEMPLPELIDVTDRVWAPISRYLPHKDGKVNVSRNPEIAKEQVYDAFKKAKKSSGNKHLDPLIRHHMPNRIVNAAISNLLGHDTLVKTGRGRWSVVRNFWASKLGWARKLTIRVMELPKLRGKRRRRRRRI